MAEAPKIRFIVTKQDKKERDYKKVDEPSKEDEFDFTTAMITCQKEGAELGLNVKSYFTTVASCQGDEQLAFKSVILLAKKLSDAFKAASDYLGGDPSTESDSYASDYSDSSD